MPCVRAHTGRAAFGRALRPWGVTDVPSVLPRGSDDFWEPLNRHGNGIRPGLWKVDPGKI
jgi:hypothetical protein